MADEYHPKKPKDPKIPVVQPLVEPTGDDAPSDPPPDLPPGPDESDQ